MGSHGRHDDYPGAVAHRLGLGRSAVDFTPSNVKQTLHIPCARGHRVDFHLATKLPPEVVAKKLMQQGWTVGHKLLCPEHSRRQKRGMTQEQARACQIEKEEETMAETPKPAPSELARARKREAMDWLTESFNVEKGQFRAGISDATIAKETGLSEDAIREMREEFYGPLGEPVELTDFRAALAECKINIAAGNAAALKAVEALEQRLGRIVTKLGLKE